MRTPPHNFSAPPANEGCGIRSEVRAQVHDFSAQHFIPLGWKRLGEEIRVVVLCADEWHHDLLSFDHITYEEVSSGDVFRTIMMFRVVGKVPRRLIVSIQHGRAFRKR